MGRLRSTALAVALGLPATWNTPGTTASFGEEPDLYPISVEGKWGYIDSSGEVKIQPQFTDAHYFSEGLAKVSVAGKTEEDRKLEKTYDGFIGPDGRFVIPPKPAAGVEKIDDFWGYSYSDFHDGLARVHINDATGMSGFIDRTGKLAIFPRLGSSYDFREGLAFADTKRYLVDSKEPDQSGFIDKTGTFVIANDRASFSSGFTEGLAAISMYPGDGSIGAALIDRNGEYVIPPGRYTAIDEPVAGIMRVVKNGKSGLIDRHGKVFARFGVYRYILTPEVGDIFTAKTKTQTFLLSAKERRVIAKVAVAGHVSRFQYGRAAIDQDGKYGFIRSPGRTRHPFSIR